MKRLFKSIAIAAALVFAVSACKNEALAPAEPSTPVLEAPSITVSVSNVTDNSFQFTVAPNGQSLYYSYLVTTEDFEPDPESLYKVSYKDIAQGTVRYDKESSFSDEIVGIDPDTQYYVYAVASSTIGNVGKVARAEVTTPDGVNPEADDYATKANIVQILFTEGITYTGKEVTAVVYAKNYRGANDKPVIPKAVAEVECVGDIAQLTFPDIVVPGSWYLVSYPEGTFVDSVGNPCEALTSSFVYDEEGALSAVSGIYGYIANENFEFTGEVPLTLEDYTKFINVTSPQMLYRTYRDKVTAKVVHVEGDVTTTTEYPVTGGKNYGVTTLYTAGFRLEEEPVRGDIFSFEIEEGAFEDIYGNKSEAFEIGPVLYSYDYSVDDIAGDYLFNFTSAYASYGYGPYANVLTIAASDNAEAGNVMFTGKLSDVDVKFYGTMNFDNGELEIPAGQKVCEVYDYLYENGAYVVDANGNRVVITCPVYMYISNGSSYYSNSLGFDFAAAHSPEYWYPSYYIGLLEFYNEAPYSWYDLLSLSSITYPVSSGTSAPAAAAVSPDARPDIKVRIGDIPIKVQKL